MNSLSWLLYAADAAESVKTACGVGAIVFAFGTTIATAATIIAGCIGEADNDDQARRLASWAQKHAKRAGITLIGLSLVWAVLPASRTIYMMAASQAGEQIVTSPDAIEMMGDLKAIIKKRLKDELAK